ncbi:hypothetical protein EKD04_013790 [Chloroflexales bacterium ZM16-3]|nr:hypothetical protein [Chloroflexales bacterium ZM16-3]
MSSSPRDDAQTIISHLAEIGPRRAGSPQEATVAAFVNVGLRRAGMGVTTHPLLVTPRRRQLYGIAAACGIFAALTAIILPLPAIALSFAAVIILALDAVGIPLARLGPSRSSQTIIGTQAISSDADAGPRVPRWRVVLLAPLDSPVVAEGIAALAGHTPAAAYARIIALALVALAALVDLLFPYRGWVLLAVPASILLALQIVAALRGPRPAAHDGGVGALTTLLLAAQRLRGLEHVEIWAVAVGATSLDSVGVEDLLNIYPFEPDHTLLIVLEELSGDQLRCRVCARAARQEVAGLVHAAADTLALSMGDVSAAMCGPLDEPLRRRGMRSLTLYSDDARRVVAGNRRANPHLSESATGLIAAIMGQLEDAG